MKIQIISDLHVEVNGMPNPDDFACDADIMIVAGDVGPAPTVMPVIAHISRHVKDRVFYLPGNHEPYGLDTTWDETVEFLKREAFKYTVDLLDTTAPAFCQGLAFGGATLWTNYRLYDSFRIRKQQYCMAAAARGMNDFKRIKDMVPEWVANRSGREASLLGGWDFDIGVSHHLPTAQSLDPKYQGSVLNAAFASNYDYLLEGKKLWVHGHTHTSLDYIHEKTGCRVVCNPKGYGDENPAFDPRKVIQIE